MRLRLVVVLLALCFLAPLAWLVQVPHRAARAWAEYQQHPRASYALAFLFAPQSELRPAAWGPACGPACIEFDADTDDAAQLAATLELENGLTFPARVVASEYASQRLRFDVSLSGPTDAWLTWTPAGFDPGYGLSPPPCGQALREIGVRPTRLEGGRVGVKLTLSPTQDALRERLHGDQPGVP